MRYGNETVVCHNCGSWRGACTCVQKIVVNPVIKRLREEKYNQFLIAEIKRLQEENAELRIKLTHKYIEDTKEQGLEGSKSEVEGCTKE